MSALWMGTSMMVVLLNDSSELIRAQSTVYQCVPRSAMGLFSCEGVLLVNGNQCREIFQMYQRC